MIHVAFLDEHPNGTVAITVTRPEREARLVPGGWRGVRWESVVAPGPDALMRIDPRVLDAIADAWIARRGPRRAA